MKQREIRCKHQPASINRALGSCVTQTCLSLSPHLLFVLEDNVAPPSTSSSTCIIGGSSGATTNNVREHPHPALLVFRCIRVKVNYFSIVEADTEAFFNKHVPFFFLCKRRRPALSTSDCRLLLGKRLTVINQSPCVAEVNGCSRLSCSLVVCCKPASHQLKIPSSPVLLNLVSKLSTYHLVAHYNLLGNRRLVDLDGLPSF